MLKSYHQLYYEAIDNIICSLKNRFDQPGYDVYCKLEQLLVKASLKEDFKAPFEFVCYFYKDDFQPDLLHAQLLTFGADFQATYREVYDERTPVQPRIFDIRDYCKSLSAAQRFKSSQPSMPSCAADSSDASDKCNIREVIQCFASSEKLP